MTELENTIELLQQYRKECKSIVRGELPDVDFGNGFIGLVFGAAFTFVGSFFVFGMSVGPLLDVWGIIPTIPFAVATTSVVVFWPIVKIYFYHRKHQSFPDEAFLEKYKSAYGWLFGFIKRKAWVTVNEHAADKPQKFDPGVFRLWLGVSTGLLIKLWHRAGMAPEQHVFLGLEDACQNILTLGAIGSGKTTGLLHEQILTSF